MAQFGWQDLGWSQALPLARDPGAAAEGLVDGLGGGADGGLDVLPRVVVQLGEVAPTAMNPVLNSTRTRTRM
jgi:hypothetical protein